MGPLVIYDDLEDEIQSWWSMGMTERIAAALRTAKSTDPDPEEAKWTDEQIRRLASAIEDYDGPP